jgi:hypothetical protein
MRLIGAASLFALIGDPVRAGTGVVAVATGPHRRSQARAGRASAGYRAVQCRHQLAVSLALVVAGGLFARAAINAAAAEPAIAGSPDRRRSTRLVRLR